MTEIIVSPPTNDSGFHFKSDLLRPYINVYIYVTLWSMFNATCRKVSLEVIPNFTRINVFLKMFFGNVCLKNCLKYGSCTERHYKANKPPL